LRPRRGFVVRLRLESGRVGRRKCR
ncbi:hypothetical protein Areg01_84110, partial [Actinoplanes regularis]